VDGNNATGAGPDRFNVVVDGTTIFSHTLTNVPTETQSYTPPAGVKLSAGSNRASAASPIPSTIWGTIRPSRGSRTPRTR